MDSMVTGDTKPEEKPDEGASEKRPPGKLNWMLIALIAVSCVAVLLLAATVTLAVKGGCGHRGCSERSERFGDGRMCPMRGPGESRWREGFPGPPENPGNQQQAQPPQIPPAPQSSQTQPPAGQGP